jgi:phosphoglycerol transferase MdoB-like AlkP superfamily enzyme
LRFSFYQLKDTSGPFLALFLSCSLLTSALVFFDALPAISLWPLLAFYVCSVGLGKHWSLSLFRLLTFIFFFIAMWSFRIEGVVFGDGFFVHAQLNTIMFMGFYPSHTATTVAAFLLFGLIEIFVIHQRALWHDKRKPLFILSIFMVGLLGLSPAPSFLMSYWQPTPKTSALPSLDEAHLTLSQKKISVLELFQTLPKLQMKKKHNVLILYLESLETHYLDEKRFPELMPFLSALRKDAVSFSNFNQNKNVFTISGLFASQCGYPFEVLTNNKDINKTLFYQGTHHLTCLSDVFAQLGFTQVFMQGTSLDFAGTRYFLESHQYNEIIGSQQLTGSAKAYATFRDKPLYANILQKVRQLSAAGQPFHISSINFDTHDPGHMDSHCKPYGDGDDNVLNAIHCFDRILKGFFESMKEEGLMDGLRIAILSDHLSMTRFKEERGRKNLLILYDPKTPQGKIIPHDIYHHDVPDILFDFLGITGTPSYPLAYSPLSQNARTHQRDEVLLTSLSRIFKEQQKEILPCNSQVSFNFKKNLFTFNHKKVFFSPGHGVLTWPKDRIALIGVDAQSRIVVKELVHAQEVMLRLSNPNIHRILLWGYLDQLEAFGHQKQSYGYFWGRLDQPKQILPLSLKETVQVKLRCQAN